MSRPTMALTVFAGFEVRNFRTCFKLRSPCRHSLSVNPRQPADCAVGLLRGFLENLADDLSLARLAKVPAVQIHRNDKRQGIVASKIDEPRFNIALDAGGVPVPPV